VRATHLSTSQEALYLYRYFSEKQLFTVMKNIPLLLFGILAAFSANSQSNDFCGTKMPEEMRTWLKNYQQGAHAAKQADELTLYYIPLKINIVGDDQGNGYYKISYLLDAMCHLNEQYEQVGFHWYIYGDVNYINNSDLYAHSDYSVTDIVNATKTPNVLNIYFVQDPAGACGYFQYWSDYVAVAKSCASPANSTEAHDRDSV